jgi:hypothetical protein
VPASTSKCRFSKNQEQFMTDTPRLGITQLEEDQALPEVVVNEATRILEAFANATHFKSVTTTAEPGSPADGDTYLVPASATGTNWAGHDGEIATFLNTAWVFKDAKEGFFAWVDDDNELLVYDGAAWSPPVAGISELDDIPDVNAPSPTNGQVLTWDSTPGEWVSQDLPAAGAFVLGDATDVDTTGVADGDVLTYDSGGGEWVPVPAAGAGGLTLLGSFAFTGAEATHTFSSISGSYRDLVLVFHGRSDRAGQTTSVAAIRLNGDTTAANYYTQTINASNATINTSADAASVGYMMKHTIPGATATAGHAAIIEAVINRYAGTTFQKYGQGDAFYSSAASAAGHTVFRAGGHWLNTAAVTSLTFFDINAANFTSGSTVELYGRG